ncbi:unnamed protein product [Auanema sp. JU1783]|nr:unnamed protein product [Auanema sp. JU1783]
MLSISAEQMGKDGDPGGETTQPKPQDPKMQAAKVHMLDGTIREFALPRGSKGDTLFTMVSTEISIEEHDYFSLAFHDSDGIRHWLYTDKKIMRQLKGLPWVFSFEVKFYPTSPSTLNDDHARYNLFLQLKNDIYSGRLPATIPTHVLLGSLVAQAEFGDASTSAEYEQYLRTAKLAPRNNDLLDKIKDAHKEHKGLTPAEAEIKYLDTCKQLSMYGVFVFDAKDKSNNPVSIGICATGINIYKETIRLHRFLWQSINKISYRKNTFALKLNPGEIDKKTLVYKVSDYTYAKRIYKCGVEHHTFFRLIQPEDKPKQSLFRWGSARFRYNGRTQFQTKMATHMFDHTGSTSAQRPNSARLSQSCDNVAKNDDSIDVLEYTDKELGSSNPLSSPVASYEVSSSAPGSSKSKGQGNGYRPSTHLADAKVVRRETNELKYHLKGEGLSIFSVFTHRVIVCVAVSACVRLAVCYQAEPPVSTAQGYFEIQEKKEISCH